MDGDFLPKPSGHAGFGACRRFPGLDAPHPASSWMLDPRGAMSIELEVGDLVSLASPSASGRVLLAAFDRGGEDALDRLALRPDQVVDLATFRSEHFSGWIGAQGGDPGQAIPCAALSLTADLVVLRAAAPLSLWAIRPATREDLTEGRAAGPIEIRRTRPTGGVLLPPPLGKVRDEFTIRSGTARAYELLQGETVQVIDIDGQQCSDFTAFRMRGLDRGVEQMIDSTATRTFAGGAYPTPGLYDRFLDGEMRPLLNLVQDTVGRHDTFALACTARGYEERGFPGHVNCSDNISKSLAPFGVRARPAWPAINFFFNSWIDQRDSRLRSEEAWSRPGDYVALRAADDLVCVSTACPDDIDPINGWNPSDIHVRIYRDTTPIRRAVAHREKEDGAVAISEESAFHSRTGVLTQHFAPARDVWAPVDFPGAGSLGEYWACRNAVTLQDTSALRKFDIIGPDAERLLQGALTRDIARLAQWRGTYALICDEQGAVIDDGTLFRLGPQLFRWCCGSEESARVLEARAAAGGLQVRVSALRGALPSLALQGPLSHEVLRNLVYTRPHVPRLDDLRWFGVTLARLGDSDGLPFMLARSGYSGELGYELFCDRTDAVQLWDALMATGAAHGIEPIGSAASEILRIEAGFAAAGAEFGADIDAFEAGLGFSVDLKKSNFTGKPALVRNATAPRRLLRGLILACDDVPVHGAPVLAGERRVGVVTSATRSPVLETAIAIARIAVEHAAPGTSLDIGMMGGRLKRLQANVTEMPFVDRERERPRTQIGTGIKTRPIPTGEPS